MESRNMVIKRALFSVYDKTGIVDFARDLTRLGVEIIATGGTLTMLKNGGVQSSRHVSEDTQFPEILEGRVKTIHPKLLGGILAQRCKSKHMRELERLGIRPIDMVVCNFYPFDTGINKELDLTTVLNSVDIGGPNLIRAAAKNFENVVVIVNPEKYGQILKELKKKGDISIDTRLILAMEAFKVTARYDKTIYNFLQTIVTIK
jgi:phosphoribosylaminoimidazolecarboxamide formyltransferase/IMP cyclohydrolase